MDKDFAALIAETMRCVGVLSAEMGRQDLLMPEAQKMLGNALKRIAERLDQSSELPMDLPVQMNACANYLLQERPDTSGSP